MIENYPNQRRMHCETGVLVNMLQYHGLEISEPMAFGIGGGLYFMYFSWFKVEDFVLLVLRTKPATILRHFSSRMHLDYHEVSFGNDKAKAQKALDDLIDQGVPVGLTVNMKGLKYLNDLGAILDFNGHNLTVIGKENGQYIIADVDHQLPNDDYVYLDETRMQAVRFMPGPSAPHGRLYYFGVLPKDFSDKTLMKQAIVKGIKETYRNMMNIPMPFFGCRGFHYLAKDMRKWEGKFSQEYVDHVLYWYYKFVEMTGTGGAGYRYIYADFLKESADIFQSEVLADCSQFMRGSADSLRRFSVGCNRYMNRSGVTLNELADAIDEAGNCEQKTFTKLKKDFLK